MTNRKARTASALEAGARKLRAAGAALGRAQAERLTRADRGTLVSALDGTDLEAVDDAVEPPNEAAVRVVDVHDVADNNHLLADALNRHGAGTDAVRGFVDESMDADDVLGRALRNAGVDVDDVVAVEVVGGDVVVFAR